MTKRFNGNNLVYVSAGLFGSGGAKAFGSAATSSAGGSFSGTSGGAFSGAGTTGKIIL